MVKTSPQLTIPSLANGDKLSRYEFERRYNAILQAGLQSSEHGAFVDKLACE